MQIRTIRILLTSFSIGSKNEKCYNFVFCANNIFYQSYKNHIFEFDDTNCINK